MNYWRTFLRRAALLILSMFGAAIGLAQGVSLKTEPVIGGPCEGCEYIYAGIPAKLTWSARIAGPTEPGQPLVLTGVVRTRDGQPAPGVIVYAYHTDARGIYPDAQTRHGRLRAWVATDREGRYRFETIRPAAYPSHDEPEHIHMHVIEPGRGTYYLEDLWFDDDPLLTATRKASTRPRGGKGLSSPKKDAAGVWQVRRDIVLGENISGYKGKKS